MIAASSGRVALVQAMLALSVIFGQAAAQAAPQVRTYTVQPGDSIWSIAEEFYGSGDKYRIIYEHNKFIGSPPFILRPGQVLTLPSGSIAPEAQVDWIRREVKAKPPRSLDWLNANNKMNLWKLYQVSTGDDSAVHIVFEDASDLRLGDNALLVIYGGSTKNATSRERVKTQVLLKEGTVRGGLASLDGPAKPMVVETPSGSVEFLSTLAQVQATALAAIVSVYEGQVEVKAQGASVKVPKGHGTVVAQGKKPEAPTALPASPGWSMSGDGAPVAIVPEGGRATFEAAWTPVDRAAQYRVELAQDAAFTRVMVNAMVEAKTTRFKLENIPEGAYFVRIAARDARGLEGAPSTALTFNVVGLHASRRLTKDESGRWEVVGLSRLDLGNSILGQPGSARPSANDGAGLEWQLDDDAFVPGTEPTRVRGPGPHVVRVRRTGSTLVSEFALRVLDVRAKLDVGGTAAFPAGGAPRTIRLELRDERGRPAPLPDVVLEAQPGGILTLVPAEPGHWTAQLPAPAPPGPMAIDLTVRWPEGVLATARIAVEQQLPPVPYAYHWREAIGSVSGDGRTTATPLPSVTPIDRIGVETAIHDRADGTAAGLTLVGELALLQGQLGLDAALTLFRPTLTRDASQFNEVGDAVLGARYLALVTHRFVLAPSFRARLPLAERDGVRTWGLEPGALLRFRVARTLWIDSRQAIFIASAFNGATADSSYVGDYAVLYRPIELVGLSAELDTAFRLTSPDRDADAAAFAAGLGVRFHVERLRIGLSLGFGIGDAGRARFGDVNAQLTLDFGLGMP